MQLFLSPQWQKVRDQIRFLHYLQRVKCLEKGKCRKDQSTGVAVKFKTLKSAAWVISLVQSHCLKFTSESAGAKEGQKVSPFQIVIIF